MSRKPVVRLLNTLYRYYRGKYTRSRSHDCKHSAQRNESAVAFPSNTSFVPLEMVNACPSSPQTRPIAYRSKFRVLREPSVAERPFFSAIGLGSAAGRAASRSLARLLGKLEMRPSNKRECRSRFGPRIGRHIAINPTPI